MKKKFLIWTLVVAMTLVFSAAACAGRHEFPSFAMTGITFYTPEDWIVTEQIYHQTVTAEAPEDSDITMSIMFWEALSETWNPVEFAWTTVANLYGKEPSDPVEIEGGDFEITAEDGIYRTRHFGNLGIVMMAENGDFGLIDGILNTLSYTY